MRILFLGNGWLGWQVLRWLVQQHEQIVGLVVHPPSRRRHGAELAQAADLDASRIFDASEFDRPEVLGAVQALQPEIGVSVLFGYLIRPELRRLVPKGIVNLHPAFLPYNRGAYPNVWSIVERTPAGVTVHYIDDGLDTGDIVAQQAVPVAPVDTGETLYRKLERTALDLFQRAWPDIRSGSARRVPQDPRLGTVHKVRDVGRIDEIDLDRRYSAREFIDILRARTFPPYDGAYFWHEGRKVYMRLQLSYEEDRREGVDVTSSIEINGRRIGPGHPTYVVAELSGNHAQDFGRAVETIHAAKAAGASAIKLQTYTPDTLTIRCDRPPFRIEGGTPWQGRTLYDLYAEAYTPWEWQPRLRDVARELGLDLFSSPFDASAVDFLEAAGMPAYKIASFEIVDLPLLRKVAQTGKPVLVSTGMATLAEIEEAVTTLRDAGCTQLALLKCTSAYPAPTDEMNLRAIPHLQQVFGVPIGLSDHSPGVGAAMAAVALGACIVEKHFILSRSLASPDASFSLEPGEFKAMVDGIRTVERALGDARCSVTPAEAASLVFRRSLFVVTDLKAGDVLSDSNVRSIRPGFGLHPRYLDHVLGRRVRRDVPRGTPLSWDLIE